MSNNFALFMSLIDRFVTGLIQPGVFQFEYMQLWRKCRDSGGFSNLNTSTNNAFDRIFTTCDCYCEDLNLRDRGDLDDQQFLSEVSDIARDLHQHFD